ncbi:retrovirus-related Pol polyprotein from transposon RE1 [Trichonephila clavipes]|nr:retrovirus-related Pol polyprotein from transposon RE1 [Trichonephila clavipes]
MKQDLEKAENAYLSSFTSKKSKTLPGATAAAHGDQMARMITKRKVVSRIIILYQRVKKLVFSDVTAKTKNGSIEIWHQRFCHVNNDYLVKTSNNDSVKGLPRLTDNGKTRCIPCKLAKSREFHSKRRGPKDNTESQGFSDLSEQQEALMVEVTIPNCYKQAIRSRDASKWHDAMDKEINVMMERKVWDLVDHPDNIKVLENRWVYTIKYDENNKIVRYKARLVARGNTQLRGESFDEVFSPVINFTIVRLFFTICVCLWKWTHIQVDITNAYLYANLDTVIYMKQPTGYEIDNNKVCKLRKAIYGLHQSGRQWFLELENK